jgi:Cdc6-like AAA superfamily ATPase
MPTKAKTKTPEDWGVMRMEVTEAFSPGAPVQERDLFAGRAAQISALEDAVVQRGRHAIVYGERGVGKTSLANVLKLMMQRPNKEVIYVRVNAEPNDTFVSLWKKVFKRMSYEVPSADGATTRKLAEDFGDALTPDDVQLVLADFTSNQIPIIVLDEFDALRDRECTQLIAHTIKALSDYSVNVTMVIVGVAEDVSTLIQGHESITRALVQIKMPRMSNDEIRALVLQRYTRCGLSTDADMIWKVCFLSRGLPYYAHLLAMHAARYAIDQRRMTVKHQDVDKALENAISELDQTIKEKYVMAVRSQRAEDTLYAPVLLACAFAMTDELGRFQQTAVAGPLNKFLPGKNYHASTYALHMNAFCEDDRGRVLQRFGTPRNYRYRFSDPMMQPYVILRGINEGKITDETAEIFATRSQGSLSFPDAE